MPDRRQDKERLEGWTMGGFVPTTLPSDEQVEASWDMEPRVWLHAYESPRSEWSYDGEEMEAMGRGEFVPCWTDWWPVAPSEGSTMSEVMHEYGPAANGGEPETDPVREPADPVREGICKVDGCNEPWLKQKGPFGRLCQRHKDAAQAVRRQMVAQADKKHTAGELRRATEIAAESKLVKATRRYEAAVVEVDEARAELLGMLGVGDES